jgi:Tol biopolymer transport system component
MGILLLAPTPARADGGVLYGVCGDSICTVSASTGKKRTLLRGTAARPYRSVSVSRSGAPLAFVRGDSVFRSGRRGRHPQRIGTALRQAAPQVDVRPDGRQVARIDVIQRPDLIGGGFYEERNLIVLGTDDRPAASRIVATDMMSAGWLGTSLLRQAYGDDGAPWFICAVTAEQGCVRSVAVDGARALNDPAGSPDGSRVVAVARSPRPGDTAPSEVTGAIALFDAASGRAVRDLTAGADLQPAFSPDGGKVAFVRGRDLFVVRTSGRREKRLARGVTSPAWARR